MVPVRDPLLLAAAIATSVAALTWLALAMDVHWRQVFGARQRGRRTAGLLRVLGITGLAGSLLLCLKVDHLSMASLVWFMTLAASALVVALTLAWRPHWLAVFHPAAVLTRAKD